MSTKKLRPSLILETSWEVCNKQGGIYTVLSSRAKEMMEQHEGRIVFVGPYFPDSELPKDFLEETPELLQEWAVKYEHQKQLPVKIGSWQVPGRPAVVLVDFQSLFQERDQLYYLIWERYGVESNEGYGDYHEASLFGIAAAQVMDSLARTLCSADEEVIAIFNEWMLGMGLLYAKVKYPKLGTLFITHATTVGRSIAGNNKALYAYMPGYFGDQMAAELGVKAKHGIEKAAAHQADLFATVSQITQVECKQLLEKEPFVLPNGFEPDFVPKAEAYESARETARKKLFETAERLCADSFSADAMLVSLSGRYEYRNKGIDLFIDAMQQLSNEADLQRDLIAFILVPAWTAEARSDLRYLLDNKETEFHTPLQYPQITHWLHNMSEDMILKHLRRRGINNLPSDKVKIIFIPSYLDGKDGILNMPYYQILMAMDLNIYPSYYEPWGYTPLESIAFGIPTITSNLSGFGLWAKEILGERLGLAKGVQVVERNDHNYQEACDSIAKTVLELSKCFDIESKQRMKSAAMELSDKATWREFYPYYLEAYRKILEKE